MIQTQTRFGASRLHLILACTGLALAGFFFEYSLRPPEPSKSASEALSYARAALTAGKYRDAESLARKVSEDNSEWLAAMLIAGEAATKDGRLQDAADYYRRVPLAKNKDAVLARFSLGEVLLHGGDLTGAQQAFTEVIEYEPGYVEAYSRLVFVLGAAGRRRESGPYLFTILRSGAASLNELVLLADLERPLNEESFLLTCQEQQPDDVLVQLGLASNAALDGRSEQALSLLQRVVARHPKLASAQCLRGELLVESSASSFQEWHGSLPANAEEWPDLWFVRGRWAEKHDQPKMAARCFIEAIRRVPLHRRANYQLGIVLARLNSPNAEEFSARARKLLELSTWLTHARESEGRNQTAMREVVSRLEEMGRIWEACAWANFSTRLYPDAQWCTGPLARLGPRLDPDLPLVPAEIGLAHLVDVSEFPAFRISDTATSVAVSATEAGRSHIRFQEEHELGLSFVYYNAYDATTPGARIQEQTGGGAAVVDIDGDSWPDLYLVQGGEWIHGRKSAEVMEEYSDRIFRNRRGAKFEDVTDQAGIHEFGFGQGCAVGDVNEDGFPDLYVANIGTNVLYLNNGDGTFQKRSDLQTYSQDLFTSSAAIADINSDGFADLFDANYVTGAEVFHLICSGRACSPSAFEGVIDQLYINSGDGEFTAIEAATPRKDAKGLGVVVARMGDAARPSVFVANDQTPNFLLTLAESEGEAPVLEDSGFRSGLAYSQDGLVTAAMGVAADDIDNNGLIDFFVTNFQDESNCLYLQTGAGFFTDATRTAGLRTASFPFVGWGTQFIDADRDGEMDLVITNGHVDSYEEDEKDSEMRSQFFRNMGGVKFEELLADDVGEFFARKFYGRALSKLDWNKDGRMDFIVVPIRAPVPLVSNVTTNPGHFVNVKLHATRSARDAIFSFVEVKVKGRAWKKQLVAGDGYHASNERVLQFGIGDFDQVEELVISWASGQRSRILQPPVDTTLEFVEGSPLGTAWHDEQAESLAVMNEE